MSPQPGMSAQMSEVRGGGDAPGAVSPAVPFARPRLRPEKALQYELNVAAADVTDTVTVIGGWLFDRAMAGWRVGISAGRRTDELGDTCLEGRALRILGLTALDPNEPWPPAPRVDAVAMTAICTDRFDSDDLADVQAGGGEVVFFGAQGPSVLAGQVHRVQYRPSAAAAAFKARALAVLGANPGSSGAVETMFRYGRSVRPLDADLVPVY